MLTALGGLVWAHCSGRASVRLTALGGLVQAHCSGRASAGSLLWEG